MFPLKFYSFCTPLLVLLPLLCNASGSGHCKRSSNCGVLLDIKYPFRLEGDSEDCGRSDYQLSCEQNRTVLYLKSNKYYVEAINHESKTIRVSDPGMQRGNCSTLPKYSFTRGYYRPFFPASNNSIILLSCKNAVKSPHYLDTAPCVTAKDFYSSSVYPWREHSYTYVLAGHLVASDIKDSCSVYKIIPSGFRSIRNLRSISFLEIHNELASGYELLYTLPSVTVCGTFICKVLYQFFRSIGYLIGGLPLVIVTRAIVGSILFFAFLVYKCRRRHLSVYDTIEEFLTFRNNVIPVRYSYKDIKKMTNNFGEILGKGGYGDVHNTRVR